MPNKKKNNKVKNGYFYFMQEVRDDKRAEGHNFRSQRELADFCAPLWAKLSPHDKDIYNDFAKRKRLEEKNVADEAATKFNSLGKSIKFQDAEIREQEENELIMISHIKNLMNKCGKTGIMTQKFYFCHVNYGFKVNDNKYAPVELALAEFSLFEGVTSRLHTFLQAGEIPLGLRYEAMEWSASTHQIPVDGHVEKYGPLGAPLDKNIFRAVVAFLKRHQGKDDDMLPVVYTMPDSLNSNDSMKAVVSTFQQLCEVANANPDVFRIFELPTLFFELRNKCVEDASNEYEFPSVAMAKEILQQHVYSSYSKMGCLFHIECDNELKCSLSAVTRWAFTLCAYCYQFLGVELVPGRHKPSDETDEESSIVPYLSPEEMVSAARLPPHKSKRSKEPKESLGLRHSMWYEQTRCKYQRIRDEEEMQKEKKEKKEKKRSIYQIDEVSLVDPEEVVEHMPPPYPEEPPSGYQYHEDEFPGLGGSSRKVSPGNVRSLCNPWRKK